MIQKTFYKYLSYDIHFPKKAIRYLNDARLSVIEKKIIEGLLLMRDGHNDEVINLIKKLPESEMFFVEAQKNFLIGVAMNNTSRFKEAEEYLLSSIKAMEAPGLELFYFAGLFNLFLSYFNSSDPEKMLGCIKKLEKIRLDSPQLKIRFLRCHFLYATFTEDKKSVETSLVEIDRLKPSMVESDIIPHMVSKFMYFIKSDRFEDCYAVLEEMKTFRKYVINENFRFMKRLLDHLVKGKAIYAYDREFENVPLLYHQLKVIQAFESQETEIAKKHWGELHVLFPDMYLDSFVFKGPKCLFSMCLNKHLNHVPVQLVITANDSLTKTDKLLRILTNAKSPMSKGLLFELLWDRTPEDKEDMKKLTKLISKIRSSHGIEVQTRKGTYFIVERIAKKQTA